MKNPCHERIEASASSDLHLEDPSQKNAQMTKLFYCHVEHSETSASGKPGLEDPSREIVRMIKKN